MEEANRKHLKELPGSNMTYMSLDNSILAPGPEMTSLLRSFIVPDRVDLKVGASVVLSKNLPDFHELANGSIGTVVDFRATDDIREDEGILFSRILRPPGIWPLVDFVCRSGAVYRVLILQEVFTVEGNRDQVLISRKQVGCYSFIPYCGLIFCCVYRSLLF